MEGNVSWLDVGEWLDDMILADWGWGWIERWLRGMIGGMIGCDLMDGAGGQPEAIFGVGCVRSCCGGGIGYFPRVSLLIARLQAHSSLPAWVKLWMGNALTERSNGLNG